MLGINESRDGGDGSTDGAGPSTNPPGGSQALLEVAVRLGLSLLFSLLNQNWHFSHSIGLSIVDFNL